MPFCGRRFTTFHAALFLNVLQSSADSPNILPIVENVFGGIFRTPAFNMARRKHENAANTPVAVAKVHRPVQPSPPHRPLHRQQDPVAAAPAQEGGRGHIFTASTAAPPSSARWCPRPWCRPSKRSPAPPSRRMLPSSCRARGGGGGSCAFTAGALRGNARAVVRGSAAEGSCWQVDAAVALYHIYTDSLRSLAGKMLRAACLEQW